MTTVEIREYSRNPTHHIRSGMSPETKIRLAEEMCSTQGMFGTGKNEEKCNMAEELKCVLNMGGNFPRISDKPV
jgi:hypothetical protein